MKKIFVCAFAAFALVALLFAFAGCGNKEPEGESAGGLVFELNGESGEYSVVGTDKELAADVVIPESLGGKKVTSIAREAFQRCSKIKSVKIPSTVKNIGPYAFAYCTAIESITVPASVSVIDNHAFRGCTALKNVSFEQGSALSRIGHFAFENCTAITAISLPSTVTSIGDAAFKDCSALAAISIPTELVELGSRAFNNCTSLTSISFFDKVTKIGSEAFRGCTALTNVYLSAALSELGEAVFWDCDNITVAKAPTAALAALPKNALRTLEINGTGKIGINALSDCKTLESVVISGNITEIDASAFYNCIALKSFVFGNASQSLPKIGRYAFYNCKSLTQITLPSGLREIGVGAFYCCTALTGATFKNTEGWSAGGADISSADLANASNAAQYLTVTYTTLVLTRN